MLEKKRVITIDGPAASGKSSAGREIARLYNLPYVYTGLLFRGLAWSLTHKAYLSQDQLSNPPFETVQKHMESLSYQYDHRDGSKVFYEGVEITGFLKDPEVDHLAPIVANNQSVRDVVMKFERELAQNGAVVDSRDAGSLVFPDAEYKFFFNASLEERVKRRSAEWQKKGVQKTAQEALAHMQERDFSDAVRGYFRLIIPDQVTFIDTTHLSKQQVLDCMIQKIGLP